MKSKLTLIVAVLVAALCFSGCSTATKTVKKANATLIEFDQLGLEEIHIPGRATATHYTVEEKDGVTRSTLTHSNPALVEPIKLVRRHPAAAAK